MKESWIESKHQSPSVLHTGVVRSFPGLFWTALSKFSPHWQDLDAAQAWNYSRGGSLQAGWLRLHQVELSFLFYCLSPPNTIISRVLGQLSIIYICWLYTYIESVCCRSAVSAQMQAILYHWPGCQGSLFAATQHWVSQAVSENQFNPCQCQSLTFPIWKVLSSSWTALLQ